MIITYTAQRSLYADHIAGTQYTLDVATTARVRSRRVERVQQKSLSGRVETLWYYGERTWNLTFEPVAGDRLLNVEEFLDSTESGEPFSMTLRGETQPAVQCKRTDQGYSYAPFLELGALDEDWFQVTVEVVEQ